MTSEPPMNDLPAATSVIGYADGASRGNPGPAAIGGVVTDQQGTVLRVVSERIGRATNNVAEWRAALAVVIAARELGARVLDLRMDSELVVRQILGVYKVRNAALAPYHQQVVRALAGFERWSASHVPREQNRTADRLANAALDGRPPPRS
jgi:ribonuclease HI